MASFLLQPCKLVEEGMEARLVPTRDPPVEFDWKDLLERLAPSKSIRAKTQLRSMGIGAFVGLTRHPRADETCNFLLQNQDRTGKIAWLLKQDPSFRDRLIEVYRVEAKRVDDKIEELASKTP